MNNELNIDRNDVNNVEMAMSQLNREIEDRMGIVREKERRLMELEKAIGETEKSYDIVSIIHILDYWDYSKVIERFGEWGSSFEEHG